jgi:hypothetical protein
VDGLVVAGGVDDQLAQQLAGGRVDDADVGVLDQQQDGGSGMGWADTDVVEAAVDPQGDLGVGVDAVVPDAVVGVVVCGGSGVGAGLVGDSRGGLAGEGPVGALVVVDGHELVQELLQLDQVGGLVGLGRSHRFSVCWNRSTLPQVVGLFGRLLFCSTLRRRSSASRASRPPPKRVVKTIALSVKVEAGTPKRATAARKRSRTIGPVTGWWRSGPGRSGGVVQPGQDLGVTGGFVAGPASG